MSGIGVAELIIIIAVGAILFGAPVLTFFLGYAVGKGRVKPPSAPAPSSGTQTAQAPDPVMPTDSSETLTPEMPETPEEEHADE